MPYAVRWATKRAVARETGASASRIAASSDKAALGAMSGNVVSVLSVPETRRPLDRDAMPSIGHATGDVLPVTNSARAISSAMMAGWPSDTYAISAA